MNLPHSQSIILAFVLIFGAIVISNSAIAQRNESELQIAVTSPSPLGLTVEQGMEKQLLFDYSLPEIEMEYRMHVTLNSNSVSWTELKEGGRTETDIAQSVKLDEHRLMMSWFEESGQFVVLYVDFLAGQTTYCGLLRPGVDDKSVCYTGTVME